MYRVLIEEDTTPDLYSGQHSHNFVHVKVQEANDFLRAWMTVYNYIRPIRNSDDLQGWHFSATGMKLLRDSE